jgi:hypothetical protein
MSLLTGLVMAKGFPGLVKSQVDEIVRLVILEGYGAKRISVLTDIPFSNVRNVLRGKTYVKWTGGPLVTGRRDESKWRHGRSSFFETILNEV